MTLIELRWERERAAAVVKIAAKHPAIAAQAIMQGWDELSTELECLRADRADWAKRMPPSFVYEAK